MVQQTIQHPGSVSIVEEYNDGTVFEITQRDNLDKLQVRLNGDVVREATIAQILAALNH
jgi:hypothetical protein